MPSLRRRPLRNRITSTPPTLARRRVAWPPISHLYPTRQPLQQVRSSCPLSFLPQLLDPGLLGRFSLFTSQFRRRLNDGSEPAASCWSGEQGQPQLLQMVGKSSPDWNCAQNESLSLSCLPPPELLDAVLLDGLGGTSAIGVFAPRSSTSNSSSSALANCRCTSDGLEGKAGRSLDLD